MAISLGIYPIFRQTQYFPWHCNGTVENRGKGGMTFFVQWVNAPNKCGILRWISMLGRHELGRHAVHPRKCVFEIDGFCSTLSTASFARHSRHIWCWLFLLWSFFVFCWNLLVCLAVCLAIDPRKNMEHRWHRQSAGNHIPEIPAIFLTRDSHSPGM